MLLTGSGGVARAITSEGLMPALRTVIEDSINDPAHAVRILQEPEVEKWPGWLKRTLSELGELAPEKDSTFNRV